MAELRNPDLAQLTAAEALLESLRAAIAQVDVARGHLPEFPRVVAEQLGEHFGVSGSCDTRLELHFERGRFARRYVHHGPIGAKT